MGYPASYRGNARPSHGFQGEKGAKSGGKVIGADFGRGPNRGASPFPYNPNKYRPGTPPGDYGYKGGAARPGHSPTFGPPNKPKPVAFGKKRPRVKAPPFKPKFIPNWWDAGEWLYNQWANPQPIAFGWNIPAGSGWVLANSCSPNQDTYNAAVWAMTFNVNPNVQATSCLGLQAFSYAGGNYPFGNPQYDPGNAYKQLTVWDGHRSIPNRWANRRVWTRNAGTPSVIPNYAPQAWDPPIPRAWNPKPRTWSKPSKRPRRDVPLRRPLLWYPDPKAPSPRDAAKPRPREGQEKDAREYGYPIPRGGIVTWPAPTIWINPTPGPVVVPNPNVTPRPWQVPSTTSAISVGKARSVRVRNNPKARHDYRKQRNEKKIKVSNPRAFKWVQDQFGGITEGLDMIDVTYYSIPKELRKQWMQRYGQTYWSHDDKKLKTYMGPAQKLAAIKDMYKGIDSWQFMRNYVKNQLEDKLYGLMGRGQERFYQNAHSRGGNQIEGNAKYRDWEYETKKKMGLDPDSELSPSDLTDWLVDQIMGPQPQGRF